MAARPTRVVNIAESDPEWRWIAHALPDDGSIAWRFASAWKRPIESRMPGPHWGRIRAAIEGRRAVASGWADMVVSHGPYTSFYAAAAQASQRRRVPHLAMSFNFTDIPGGARFAMMKRGFKGIDRFTIFSRMERKLYADLFDIDPERFDFVPWGVAAPISQPLPKRKDGRYFVAVGGEARDYATLVEAARLAPAVQFVFIVRPWSLEGLSVPDNVEVHVVLPWAETWSHVWHAEAALLPLRSARTPNGHVTIVGGMHLDKAHVVTDSIGIRDYASEETALLVPAQDPAAFARAVERMMDEPALAPRLGAAAGRFARENCTEAVTARYFREFLAAHPVG